MLLIGLTGGIGAGKSTVAARLAELGATVIDSDVLAREVVAPGTDGLAEVIATFGASVLTADGALDRQALAREVFADPAKRSKLERIIHPRVRERAAQIAAAAPVGAIVVNDVPLLVESGLAGKYDLVIVVVADPATRVARLTARGLPAEQASARIAAQTSDAQRAAVADIVITNDGSLDQLRQGVDWAWRERILPRAAQQRMSQQRMKRATRDGR